MGRFVRLEAGLVLVVSGLKRYTSRAYYLVIFWCEIVALYTPFCRHWPLNGHWWCFCSYRVYQLSLVRIAIFFVCLDNWFEVCRTAKGDLDCIFDEYLEQLKTFRKMRVYEVEELFSNFGFDWLAVRGWKYMILLYTFSYWVVWNIWIHRLNWDRFLNRASL